MVEDVPIIDFVQYVQGQAVKAGLTGADAALPVLSIAAPFSRTASFPAGEVSVRDVAGLYIYDNTLLAVKVTGAQLKDYLEFSARYFKKVAGTGPFAINDLTNAVTPSAPNGTPDYNFDSVAGLDARLTYTDRRRAGPGRPDRSHLAYDGVAGDADPGVRAGGQQLPPVRWRRVPGGRHGAGRLQPAGRDPAAAHRLGDRQPHDRPDAVRERGLEPGVERQPDHDHVTASSALEVAHRA